MSLFRFSCNILKPNTPDVNAKVCWRRCPLQRKGCKTSRWKQCNLRERKRCFKLFHDCQSGESWHEFQINDSPLLEADLYHSEPSVPLEIRAQNASEFPSTIGIEIYHYLSPAKFQSICKVHESNPLAKIVFWLPDVCLQVHILSSFVCSNAI